MDNNHHTNHRSSVIGASSNLINAIVGAGIVGIPFAIRQAGLVAGMCLVVAVALLACKSLRLLIACGQTAQATSYESLCEAAFGKKGHTFISLNMFFLAYGSMVSYCMIVKDTLPPLLLRSLELDKDVEQRVGLIMISTLIMVPLSSLKTVASLAKFSRLNVMFDTIMVLLVVHMSPMETTLATHGGLVSLIQTEGMIHVQTIFSGLGVLSFAFVCQHSAFLIYNTLDGSWNSVTVIALGMCGSLALLCGVGGYLGFLNETQGNILNNFGSSSTLANTARALLGTTMLFVYPMESIVARHAALSLLQKEQWLEQPWKRVPVTMCLYGMAVVPALLFDNLGSVLSVTGTIGGSCLSYIGPGLIYLSTYKREFHNLVEKYFEITKEHDGRGKCGTQILWIVLGMPLWTRIIPKQQATQEEVQMVSISQQQEMRNEHDLEPLVVIVEEDEFAITEPTTTKPATTTAAVVVVVVPRVRDFCVAVGYICFGMVALIAGLISIFFSNTELA